MSLIKWLPLFILGALSESATQICLKKGALVNDNISGIKYYFNILSNKWVLSGIAIFIIDMVVWVVLLAFIPLSIAFPLTGFQKIFIILFTVFILKEKVSKIEWLGIGLISLGISIIVFNG